ncbi:forkhead transcription factor Q1 [Apostichopus japonicus]|uniref:Forkhead transcription factor Q1 n=1 Tax=Stichopus japonicus TaxID=307972 RepID=A0A2G8LM93_STIJA|nr:forkhead transcription factor Q1 [Apostichopus japonicus]
MAAEENTLVVEPKRKSVQSKRPHYQRHLKLPDTYSKLIAMAIKDSKSKMVTLHEIQAYLKERYSCFNGTYVGWKNSLRHNLSANPAFVKVLRDGDKPKGKDNYWTIDESVKLDRNEEKTTNDKKTETKVKQEQGIEKTAKSDSCKPKVKKSHNLSFSIDNLLKPSPRKRKEVYTSSNVAVSIPAKRTCHRLQLRQTSSPYGNVWLRRSTELCKYEYCNAVDERLPVCYSERFRIEELRSSRLSHFGLSRRQSMFVACELEGCELNHQDDFIECELDNCKVCKPGFNMKTDQRNEMYKMKPAIQRIPRHVEEYELSCSERNLTSSEAHLDFSAYEIDPGRLENLRETLEVQACGGVKAGRIREED